ncbi:MAG: glycogen synthase [Candidatus Scalindua sp. AMX11]|nr:MAG: glycogen synthase [Candidatus Scalindua sp.]NOG85658.1 glycogen synthase [Planctomycetota bacterium]RZV82450.1 MAG: glycogen synthase [Candidatus Scalindua sp. SCAELEC01]TDE65628.1 MAG: glycogen synthase [Candidatus Scalindua sp. AMX11]GJQ59174.1 MAG: glycogen synthase [Candidatus Scalindua sp.]
MFIVMIASECAPVAKVGGLADVIYGLSRELEIRGNDVEIILPKYDCMRYEHIYGLQKVLHDLWVPFYDQKVHCSVFFGFVHQRKCFFIEPHSERYLFDRGLYYGHHDDAERFAFFCRASLEFMMRTEKHPEIIHCHDWQTGLVPVLLFDIYKYLGMTHPRVCYTLHNLKHQGVTGEFILREVGLDNTGHYLNQDRLQDNFNSSAINLMKGGIVYSNFVTTVSPQYANEIMTTDQGFGLGHTLYEHRNKFGGVLNGIDYDFWNSEIDRNIPYNYGIDSLDYKFGNKDELRQRLLLRRDFKPIIAYIGRLDHQKGLHLIKHAIFYALKNSCQFVLLGSSTDHDVNDYFWQLKRQLNDNPDCHLEIGFNEELAHLIYAGADMMIIPSLFEPCGLTQLIAMKYGTIPIVRNTGGLSDTVFDADTANKPFHERNGYVFDHFNEEGLESALHRAIGMWYSHPALFRELMINGMKYDYSWNSPGKHYVNIYNYIRE